MDLSLRLLLIRLLALAALAVSAALLVDSFLPASRLCGWESSCREVVGSAFGRIAGVPLSAIGLVGFATLFGLSFASGRSVRRGFRVLALLGGVGGLVLIAIQACILQRFCPYCLAADGAALGIAVLAIGYRDSQPLPSSALLERALWSGAAILVPLLGGLLVFDGTADSATAGPVPAEVSAHWVPGKVTIVECFDFECRHCRRMHGILVQVLREQGDRIRHVRIPVAKPEEPGARHAARAYRCAEKQGKGAEMAEALFRAGRLDAEVCAKIAGALGLSLPTYRADLADPALDEQMEADLKWLKAAAPEGLPAIWVQDRRFSGDQKPATLRRAMQAAVQQFPAPR
jgi:protein-disulfide isomerase/uncharacterized membrane protein